MRKPTAIAAIVLILSACAALLYGQEPTLDELQQRLEAAETYRDGVKAELDTAKATVTTLEAELLSAELAVVSAQRDVDNYVPPVDPPQPGEVIPLTVNGEPWTFATEPPVGLKIKCERPRFLLERFDATKLADPAYALENRLNRDNAAYWALLYAATGDTAKGEAAKAWLLEQSTYWKDYKYGDTVLDLVMVYDWTHDLYSVEERERALEICFASAGMQPPAPGSIEWTVLINRNQDKGAGFSGWFGNDKHEPRSHGRGVMYRVLIALAFHGDGVRDEWCEYVFQRMLDGGDGRIYPIYDPATGGLLDLHNIMALNSSGSQAGDHGIPITGYTGMFYGAAWELMLFWESATGDELFSRDNAYRHMPSWLAYEMVPGQHPGDADLVVALTGLYRDIEPNEAALAKHLCDTYYADGRFKNLIAFIVADKSVAAKAPAELLPPTAYRDGADRWYSQTGWAETDTHVRLTTRAIDSNRYEPAVGLLAITSRGQKLLIAGQAKKGGMNEVFGSGVWTWPTDTDPDHQQQGSTYWSNKRATDPLPVATDPLYWGPTPTEVRDGDGWHVCTVDSATLRAADVSKAKRTVVHLQGEREFVVVYDRVSVGADVSQCWGCRVMNKPTVAANQFTAVNGAAQMVGTVLTPGTIEVRGGPGKATEGPTGAVPKDVGYEFTADDSGRAMYGSYAVFVKQPGQSVDYCVVLEIGDAGFVPAAAAINGKTVSVDVWTVDFSTEDETKVSK